MRRLALAFAAGLHVAACRASSPPDAAVVARPSSPSAPAPETPAAPFRRTLAEPSAWSYTKEGNVSFLCLVTGAGLLACGAGEARATMTGVADVLEVAAGHDFVCALDRRGAVSCVDSRTEAPPAASPLTLPFRVRAIAGVDHGLTVQAEDGSVRLCRIPYERETIGTCASLDALDVPDVDAYAESGSLRCRLDRARRATCETGPNDNSEYRDWQPLATNDLPQRVRRIVAGLGSYETGAVVCAVGMEGELACFRDIHATREPRRPVPETGDAGYGFAARLRRIGLPGRVRDIALGSTHARVVTEDGDLLRIALSIMPAPRDALPAGALFSPVPLVRPTPIAVVGGMRCEQDRAGDVTCDPVVKGRR